MSYELVETESFWAEPLGEKTHQMVCDYCNEKDEPHWNKKNTFQVFFEGDWVYFVCSGCAQVIDPIKIQK
jgi:hypothetical protein